MIYFIFALYVLVIHYKHNEYDHLPAAIVLPFFAAYIARDANIWVFGQAMLYSIILCAVLGRFICKSSLTSIVSYALIGVKLVIVGISLALHSANADSPKVGDIRELLQYIDLIILLVLALSLNGVKAVLYEGFDDYKRRFDGNQP